MHAQAGGIPRWSTGCIYGDAAMSNLTAALGLVALLSGALRARLCGEPALLAH